MKNLTLKEAFERKFETIEESINFGTLSSQDHSYDENQERYDGYDLETQDRVREFGLTEEGTTKSALVLIGKINQALNEGNFEEVAYLGQGLTNIGNTLIGIQEVARMDGEDPIWAAFQEVQEVEPSKTPPTISEVINEVIADPVGYNDQYIAACVKTKAAMVAVTTANGFWEEAKATEAYAKMVAEIKRFW